MYKIKKGCIFISINKDFINILKICLLSISKNYPQHPDIIICHTDIKQQDIDKIKKMTDKIIFIKNNLNNNEIGPIMNHLPKNIDPKVFYARFLIWKLPIFKKYKSVLHLDADTIILEDCNKIFNKNKFYIEKESYTGDDGIFINHKDKKLLKIINKDGLKISYTTGNAGIFLIPSKYINIQTYNEMMNILKKYKNYIKRADQSILNIWIYSQSIKISKNNIYNFQHRILMKSKDDGAISGHSIIHFNGVPDPYRVFFMRLLLILSTAPIGIKIYKHLYIMIIGIFNIYQKFTKRPIYKIY